MSWVKASLEMNKELAQSYRSNSQKSRIITEAWVEKNLFCPACGSNKLRKFKNNKPVADFFCNECSEEFELKSKSGSLGNKINDGAYKTMIKRINEINSPNFLLLSFKEKVFSVENLMVIPSFFFVKNIIEKRKPLNKTARRAGWQGCNILFNKLPKRGHIHYIKNGMKIPKREVIMLYNSVGFLKESNNNPELKGWLLDVMNCIDIIKKEEFELDDIYAFEEHLRRLHPNNKHIKDKIRQQLQYLRNRGYVEFISPGKYKVIKVYN